MARVRARARGQREDEVAAGQAGGVRERDQGLYRDLHQASLLSDSPRADYQPGWKTPIVGHAWLVVRRWLHQEIRIYVDALQEQQSAFNTTVARALTRVVERQEGSASREELAELRAEVEALRRQLAELREGRDSQDAQDGGIERDGQDGDR